MSRKSIFVAQPTTLEDGARAEHILPRWVLSGVPRTRTWNLLRSHDLTSDLVVWECTAGVFECRYNRDETVVVVDGEVFVKDRQGDERRLGPGDLGFFPAGTCAVWRVPEHVRKIAILREPVWRPVGFALKAWKRLRRVSGMV